MKLYHQNDYTVRRLIPREWAILRQIRLEAVQAEPNVFVRPFEDEAQTTEAEWIERLGDDDRAYFGLFHYDEIVGLSGIARHSDDPAIGVMVASYIQTTHRGLGLSNLFYQARIDWALKKNLRKLIVSHQKSNEASRAAIQKHHFAPTYREMKTWPDGRTEEQLFYELDLQKWKDLD